MRDKLEKAKRIPNKQPNKNNPDEEIAVPSKIYDVKMHTFGIIGNLKFGFQKKNEFIEKEHYDITSQEYNFLIAPKNGILILHGPSEYRIRVMDLISKIIHGNDDGLFSKILIEKFEMRKLAEKIIKVHSENNLEEGKFRYRDEPYKRLKKVSFATTSQFCATKHEYFSPHYQKCSSWSCSLRIHKCNGIMDTVSETSQRLGIGLDATFSLTIEAELKEWNRFILETCKEALKLS